MAADRLEGFPVVIELDVAWGEMDAFAHVNNVVYFRYFENSRLEYFRRAGWLDLMQETGVGPIIHSTRARYRRPVTYPDRLAVGTRLVALGDDRFTLEHAVFSGKLGEVAAEGEAVAVCYHYGEGRKEPLPAELVGRLAALEGRQLSVTMK